MVADLSNLVRLRKSQIKPAADVLARAFQDDPLFVYFFPNASERKKKSPYIFQLLVHYGVLYSEVYATSPNLEGVAVWLPSEKTDMSFRRTMRSGVLLMIPKIGKEVTNRLQCFDEYVTPIRQRHAPFRHWYLQIIGVDPEFQGKGYGSTLLKPMFARMDREQLPCYLETESQKNVSIYQHYGFKVVEEVKIPGTELSNWSMLREKSS